MEETTTQNASGGQPVELNQSHVDGLNGQITTMNDAARDSAASNRLKALTEPAPATDNGFKIPDLYKEEAWAKNIKSNEDAWNVLANAQKLIGKKTIGLPDWKDAQQVNEYLSKVRPEKPDSYKFPDSVAPEQKEKYSGLLHKAGLSEYQAEMIINEYFADMQSQQDRLFSPKSLEASLKNEFQADDVKLSALAKEVKEVFGDEFLENPAVTNDAIVAVFKAMDKIKASYGVKELTAAATGKNTAFSNMSMADIDRDISEKTREILSLENSPSGLEKVKNLKKELLSLHERKNSFKGA